MTRTNKTLFAVLLALCLALATAFSVVLTAPIAAHADERAALAQGQTTQTDSITTRTEALNVYGLRESQSNEAEGWSWDYSNKTMTLRNANFEIGYKSMVDINGDTGIKFGFNTTLYIPEGTTSRIHVEGPPTNDPTNVNTIRAVSAIEDF